MGNRLQSYTSSLEVSIIKLLVIIKYCEIDNLIDSKLHRSNIEGFDCVLGDNFVGWLLA